ncbi:D-alanyl-D-alanine carboxypeptidase family protein [Salinibacterium soli]|uniref:D-alanyl-D-alanine carboxypeptidase n=1 Tax=Antiquaquibacter soli TaxID=3064523 RepID=A0ABT9BLN3_9MICO|nr:D-alanyl-D-alanine carboxypeptidase [Protaetiibacter sp. WY-16]MDO7881910.1 D-alanyl-D-alanine carboxypeptidase [Protaetiibacter sp. WY-16]
MPLTRRQIYRRRRIAVFGGAGLVLAAGFYLPLTLLAPLHETTPTVSAIEVQQPTVPVIDFPPYGAAGFGAVGYDGVLASAGTADPLPIASITKVVTALVVLEAHPLAPGEQGPTATLAERDVQFYADMLAQDGIVAPVSVGLQVTQRGMMQLALMASANNYAQSLAAWAFGSEAAYVDAARDWLGRNGLTGTTIVDATGIQPSNSSTVSDLIAIAKLAVANPVVAEIVATPTTEVPGVGPVVNRNGLLGVDGVDGIKTGTLDESGACLLFAQDIVVADEPITIVGVVLGGPDHDTINAAIRGMLAQADSGFQSIPLAVPDEVAGTYETEWGDRANAVPAEPASVVAWTGSSVSAAPTLDPVHLAEDGEEVGSITFTVGPKTVVVPLELDGDISDPGPWWRLTHPALLF